MFTFILNLPLVSKYFHEKIIYTRVNPFTYILEFIFNKFEINKNLHL